MEEAPGPAGMGGDKKRPCYDMVHVITGAQVRGTTLLITYWNEEVRRRHIKTPTCGCR